MAVRLQRPLIIWDNVRDAGILEELTQQTGLDDFHAAIVAAGYDGVVIYYRGELSWVVAYEDDQVRVVVEDDRDE